MEATAVLGAAAAGVVVGGLLAGAGAELEVGTFVEVSSLTTALSLSFSQSKLTLETKL